MVSADNLNQDVLELIMTFLPNTGLACIALVSRSFYAAIIPKLYRIISFRASHATRFPRVKTAFATISIHPWFATYVRNVDIRTVPLLDSRPHPKFLLEASQAMLKCKNLTSFKCMVIGLPTVLKWVNNKPNLSELQFRATSLTTEQVGMLMQAKKLCHLSLENASCNALDLLPRWAERISSTLTSLTLYMTPDLNEIVLEGALQHLPNLTTLAVIGCHKIDHITVLRLLYLTPLIESLGFTVMETGCPLGLPPPVPHLQHLVLDTQNATYSSMLTSETLMSILPGLQLSSPEIASFIIKSTQRQSELVQDLIKQLLTRQAPTLRRLSILDTTIPVSTIEAICKSCVRLERLDVAFPISEIPGFTKAVGRSKSLRTLIDVDTHTVHGLRRSLNNDNVCTIMEKVPSLQRVVTGQRVWTAMRESQDTVEVAFERRPNQGSSSYWFARHE